MWENPSAPKIELVNGYLPPHLPAPHFVSGWEVPHLPSPHLLSSATRVVVLKATRASNVAKPKISFFILYP